MSERRRPRMHRQRGRGLWITARCECPCGHEWVAVAGPFPPQEARDVHEGTKQMEFECPRCGTMGGRIMEQQDQGDDQ